MLVPLPSLLRYGPAVAPRPLNRYAASATDSASWTPELIEIEARIGIWPWKVPACAGELSCVAANVRDAEHASRTGGHRSQNRNTVEDHLVAAYGALEHVGNRRRARQNCRRVPEPAVPVSRSRHRRNRRDQRRYQPTRRKPSAAERAARSQRRRVRRARRSAAGLRKRRC